MTQILFHKGHNLNVPMSFYIPPLKLGMYCRSELETKESWEAYPLMPRGEKQANIRMIYLRILDGMAAGFRKCSN